MNTDKITCPECGAEIPITETLQTQLRSKIRTELEQKMLVRENDIKEREQASTKREKTLVIEKETHEVNVARQVKEQVEKGREQLAKQIRSEEQTRIDTEFDTLKADKESKEKKIAELRTKVLESNKSRITIEQEKDDLELKYQEKLFEDTAKVEKSASDKLEIKYKSRLAEQEKKLSDYARKLDEAQNQIQQGSQQLQGEVAELELEQILKSQFPLDSIIPVPKGQKGADVLQKVITSMGDSCGTIIWESKKTKNWSNAWIKKLKDDQLEQKADIAILYTATLPKDCNNFAIMEDVWITNHVTLIPFAMALRYGLIDSARSRKTAIGKNEKMELLYEYLTGKEFSQRISVIVQSYIDMRNDLDKEKRAMHKIWSSREKLIERGQINVASMYGGLEGIAGASIPQIESLELKALPDSSVKEGDTDSESGNELPF